MNKLLDVIRYVLWRPPKPERPQKICIHRVGQIGDLVCAIPAMDAIRKNYPSAEITLLSSPGKKELPGAKELLSGSKWIDHIWIYYSDDINSFPKIVHFINTLRQQNFDIWLQLPQNLTTFPKELRNMLFTKLVGVQWATGYYISKIPIFFQTQAKSPKIQREVMRQLAYLQKLNITSKEVTFPLPISEKEKQRAYDLIQQYNFQERSVLALVPGGKRLANQWPVERFAEIAIRWTATKGKVVILGGPGDYKLAEVILKFCKNKVINLCGKMTLLESAELLKHCTALVTNDTGPMHLAAAVGAPCVVTFSARDFPVRWYPWGEQHEILRKDVTCSPCFLDECPNENLCLSEITVDEVWQAVQRVVL
ncbi:MAG: glycosyltransferase family 9 protein [SAR324 cluster bacterium]|nr:glycosyltransferase family 9 protein [SAR324 cluster bacterium]